MKKREQAQAQGIAIRDTNHSMLRRAPWHDYYRPGFYMLTMVVRHRRPVLGSLVAAPVPHVVLSRLGQAILDEELPKMHDFYPNITLRHVCIMPDHIHVIVHVGAWQRRDKHLGHVVAGFKQGCNRGYWVLCGKGDEGLFEPGYNDRILLEGEQMQRWEHYLDDNPRRLQLKHDNPSLFTVVHGASIAGRHCQMVGNRFLLDIPDKVAVIVHRRYSADEVRRLSEEWLACGERGGVLVGTGVAEGEKAVMREAMNRGYRLILLRSTGFPALYKPSGEAFDACARGQLLEVSPWEYSMQRQTITRQQCLELNDMAEALATNG